MNEGGAARRRLRSSVTGAARLAVAVGVAACSGGTSIGGNSGGGSGTVTSAPAAPTVGWAGGLTWWIRPKRWIVAPGGYRIHQISHIHRVIFRRGASADAWVSRFPLLTATEADV
jgi:hypothetical protein